MSAGEHEAEHPGATGGERSGSGVGQVAEAIGDELDTGAHVVADPGLAVEGPDAVARDTPLLRATSSRVTGRDLAAASSPGTFAEPPHCTTSPDSLAFAVEAFPPYDADRTPCQASHQVYAF